MAFDFFFHRRLVTKMSASQVKNQNDDVPTTQ
jgi:hypothetical protein